MNAPVNGPPILDPELFGRRLRALRILEGFDRVSDFVDSLRDVLGFDVSDRTVYAIERGEQVPHVDFYLAVLALLHPAEGHGYFSAAIRADVSAMIRPVDIPVDGVEKRAPIPGH